MLYGVRNCLVGRLGDEVAVRPSGRDLVFDLDLDDICERGDEPAAGRRETCSLGAVVRDFSFPDDGYREAVLGSPLVLYGSVASSRELWRGGGVTVTSDDILCGKLARDASVVRLLSGEGKRKRSRRER